MGKFKSGDILVCEPGFHGDEITVQQGIDDGIQSGGSGYVKGLIATVDDVSGDICFGFAKGHGVFGRALRYATEDEKNAYQAGIVHVDDTHIITGKKPYKVEIDTTELAKGDTVFIGSSNSGSFKKMKPGDSVDKFYCDSDGIPSDMIKHGSTICTSGTGTVVDFYNQYVVVEYKHKNKSMRLGFLRKDLERISIEMKSFTISYIDAGDNLQKVTIEAESKEAALSSIKTKSINYVMGG